MLREKTKASFALYADWCGKKETRAEKGNRDAALSDSDSYRQTWLVARELCHELDQGEKKSRRERVVQIGVSEERSLLCGVEERVVQLHGVEERVVQIGVS